MAKQFKPETLCVQAGWTAEKGRAPCIRPSIKVQLSNMIPANRWHACSTLKTRGYFYTRLQNPTNDAVAAKIAALEGGVGAMLTSIGTGSQLLCHFQYLPGR